MESRFDGKHVLVVEDDYLIATETKKLLESLGAVVFGPTSSVGEALAIIETGPIDAALLDIKLPEDDAYSIADELMARGIPFVFVSGAPRSSIPARFDGFRLVPKPMELRLIVEALFGLPH
jgi:CheY-like chemotaxis protein